MQGSEDIAQTILRDRAKGSLQLVSEYRERLYAVAFSLCRDATEAEDLVFRTIERVLDRIETYQEQDSFYDWMCVILLNLYRDSRRGKTARGTVPVGGAAEMEALAPTVDADTVIAAVDADIARRALEKIPAQMREVLILHYFMDMSVRQIARTLLVPTGTVMSRLHYARIALAQRLGSSLKKPAVALIAAGLFLLVGVAAVMVGGRLPSTAVIASGGEVSTAQDGTEATEETEAASSIPAADALSVPSAPEDPFATSSSPIKGENAMKRGKAAAAALTVALAATPVSATVLQGASSREQPIALVARDRTHTAQGFNTFLARYRDSEEEALAKFRSDEPKGTVVVFR